MRPTRPAILLLLALAACSKRPPPPTEPTPPLDPEVTLAALLGSKPALLGPLASIAQRTPVREARKQAPELFFADRDDDSRDVTVAALPGLKLSVSIRCTTARGCRVGDWIILLPKEHALPALTRAWGAPVESDGALSWFNPTDRLRARVETRDTKGGDTAVGLTHYTPIAELLGDGALLPFEDGRPVFGRPVEEVMREHRDWKSPFADTTQLALPPTEWDSGDCALELSTDDRNRVTRFAVWVGYGDPRSRDALAATFERRFGKPRRERDALLFLPPGRRVVATDDTKSRAWKLEVTPRR